MKQLDQGESNDALSFLNQLVFSCYDIRIDDQEMKKLLQLSSTEAEMVFDQLRKDYRVRNEFDKTSVLLSRRSCWFKSIGFSD